jgi:hypothetical protein
VRGILLGFALLAVCALIHATSMVLIAEWLIKRRQVFAERHGARSTWIILSSVFALIILLHFAEVAFWAITYYSLGLFNDFLTSLEFSLGSYTTNSAPGILLPAAWRLLGQFEAIAGALLVGLSTAFLFLVVHKMFEIRQQASQKKG